MSLPVLALLRANGQYTKDNFASDVQIGCILLQDQDDDVLKAIEYWSRTLVYAERRFDKTHKERLAVVWSVTMLKLYLGSSQLKIRADHQALKLILDLKVLAGRLTRWPVSLLKPNFEVIHGPGVYHQAAYKMSRLLNRESLEGIWKMKIFLP